MLRITPPTPKRRGWWEKKDEPVVLLTKSLSDLVQAKPALGCCVLDDEFAELLIQLAWHASVIRGTEMKVEIHTLDPLPGESEQLACKVALQNTFRHSARMAELTVLQTRDNVCDGLAVSIGAVLLCLAVFIPLALYYKNNPSEDWALALSQVFVVLLWVLIWHPAESLVYDRLPLRRRSWVCHRLDKARVSFVCVTQGEEGAAGHGEFEMVNTVAGTTSACSLL